MFTDVPLRSFVSHFNSHMRTLSKHLCKPISLAGLLILLRLRNSMCWPGKYGLCCHRTTDEARELGGRVRAAFEVLPPPTLTNEIFFPSPVQQKCLKHRNDMKI